MSAPADVDHVIPGRVFHVDDDTATVGYRTVLVDLDHQPQVLCTCGFGPCTHAIGALLSALQALRDETDHLQELVDRIDGTAR